MLFLPSCGLLQYELFYSARVEITDADAKAGRVESEKKKAKKRLRSFVIFSEFEIQCFEKLCVKIRGRCMGEKQASERKNCIAFLPTIIDIELPGSKGEKTDYNE